VGAGVESDFGTDGDWGKGITLGVDLDIVVGDDAEGSDIILGVAIDILDPSNLRNEILVKKLQSQPLELFTIAVDDVVLVGVGVGFPSAGGGIEEVGEEGCVHSIMIIQELKKDGSGGRVGSYGRGGSVGWSGEWIVIDWGSEGVMGRCGSGRRGGETGDGGMYDRG
jgi:hypothetical protein